MFHAHITRILLVTHSLHITFIKRSLTLFAITAIIVLPSIVFSSCTGQDEGAAGLTGADDKKNGVPVEVLTIEPRDFIEYGRYYGEIRAVHEAVLITPAGGQVYSIDVQVGDTVSRGQSLATIDPGKAEAALETAVLSEEIARESYERQKRFFEAGNTAQVQVDQAHLAWMQSKAALLDARDRRDGAFCISPLEGIVAAKHIELYESVRPGSATFTVADMSQMKVTVGIPESDIRELTGITGAEVHVAAYPDTVWQGEIISIDRVRSERSLTYDIEIIVDNSEGLLFSGSTAAVSLKLQELEDQIVVPVRTVLTRGEENFVMIVNDMKAHRIPVKTGPSNDTEIVITDGIIAGAKLIIEGVNKVSDGTHVRID
jgi:RND family efflux transporter MFP subunit